MVSRLGRDPLVAYEPGVRVDGRRERRVQAGVLAGEQVVVDGLADERVPERGAVPVVAGAQDPGVDRFAQRRVERVDR